MSCSINQIRLYSYLFVCSVLLSFIFSLFSYSSVSATSSDITFSWNSSNYTSSQSFLSSSDNLTYHYILLSFSDVWSDPSNVWTVLNVNGNNLRLYLTHQNNILLVGDYTSVSYTYGVSSMDLGGYFSLYPNATIDLVISESNPLTTCSCPSCPECEDCNAPYSNVLHEILHAIFVIPATALVIYFFYCIYRMMIRSTGGRQ